MGLLRLAVLGHPEVLHDDSHLTFSLRKAQALLLYLGIEGGMHSRAKLAAFFWPDSAPHDARTALRNAVALLHRLLADTQGQNAHLLCEGGLLGLNTQALIELDLVVVQQAYTAAQFLSSGPPHSAMLTQVQNALSLVRGPFLDGFWLSEDAPFDEWHKQQEQQWHMRLLFLLDRLSSWYQEAGEQEQAIPILQRRLALDRLSEETSRRLMQAHLSLGDLSTAWQVYTTCRACLAAELQVPPSQETITLAQCIRAMAAYSERSAIRSASQQSGGLIAPLVGRGKAFTQLTQCYRLAQQAKPQMVFVVGDPGSGKTRLTSEFVAWARAHGADVLWGQAFETGGLSYQPFVEAIRPRLEQENAPEDLLDDLWLAELSRMLPELRVRYPDLPVPSEDVLTSKMRLFEAVVRLVDALAQHAPLVFVLDDMHWIDGASWALLCYLAQSWIRLGMRVLLLGTVCSEELERNPQLMTQLADLERDFSVTRVPLQPLSQTETIQLIRAIIRMGEPSTNKEAVERCHEPNLAQFPNGESGMEWERQLVKLGGVLFTHTDGLPLYLLETLKLLRDRQLLVSRLGADGTWKLELTPQMVQALAEPLLRRELLPPSVRSIIQTRLTRLTTTTRQLVMAGAALGKRERVTLLWKVADVEAQVGLDALAEAIRNKLMREEEAEMDHPHTYRFTHEMFREVIYSELGEARRHVLHQRILALLRNEGTQASTLAYHAWAAGEVEAASRYTVQAGDEALGVFAIADAIRYYEQVRVLLQGQQFQMQGMLTASEIGHLYISLGRAYTFQHAYKQAREVYEEFIAYARKHQLLALVSMGLNHLAVLVMQQSTEHSEVHTLLAEAWRMAQISQDQRVLAETAWYWAQTVFNVQLDPMSAVPHAMRALELARATHNQNLEARCLALLGLFSLLTGAFGETIALVEASLALYAVLEEKPCAVWVLSLTFFPRASSPTQSLTNRAEEAFCWGLLSMAYVHNGQFHSGIRCGRKALELAQESENAWAQVIGTVGLTHGLLDSGAYEEAFVLVQETMALVRDLSLKVLFQRCLLTLGSTYHVLQQWEEARRMLEEAESFAETFAQRLLRVPALSQLCMNYAVIGDWEEAHQYALKAIAVRKYVDAASTLLDFYWHDETEALLRGGDECLAREEVQRWEGRLGSSLRFRLPYLRSLAVLAIWDGDTEQAIDHLHKAAETAADLGLLTDRWQILAALGRVYEAASKPRQAYAVFGEAATIIQGLADGIVDEKLRTTFLAASQIQQVIRQAQDDVWVTSKNQASSGTGETDRIPYDAPRLHEQEDASQEVLALQCPSCGSNALRRDGRAPNGKQKYRCQICRHRCRDLPTPNAYPEAYRQEILEAYRKNSSLRSLTRTFGVSRTTVSLWLKKM